MPSNDAPRLIPTGTCWCGCKKEVGLGRFFTPGHDKVAEAALIAVKYGGSVPQMLHANGFGPGHSITDKAVHDAGWERCGRCGYVGAPASMRNHEKKPHKADS
ncbi:hypothetical protein NLX86_03650 [Streptomyces sp. A3M-1-3]|uniref:hypothetical protein n=1 Tax=Streptomyces sp. A3M-1-3 TaxID=2962044 RepID=UPI0020B64E78|nr:hypothetical protein [Streptomyces sp. A3M-1-3]MCP3817264.1 hypothetical protein [Streptomyces sp. A3M-1-3]